MALIETNVTEKIGYITFNRPDKLNALNLEMRDGFVSALSEFRANPDVRVIIISGKGRAFCTGFDLSGMDPEEPTKADAFYLEIFAMPQPVIAAIHGHCLAQGAGIALCSDIRVASEDVRFGWPQVLRGLSSVSGPSLGTHYLPLGISLEHLFTGEFLNAEELFRCFVVNRVVPLEKLMPTAEELARKILAGAPLAVRVMKEAALQGLKMPLESRMRFSGTLMSGIIRTEDAQEGLRAFAEKRQPIWKGK